MTSTGWLYSDEYLKHLPGHVGHPERPERLTAIRQQLAESGWLDILHPIEPRPATPREAALAHDNAYLALLQEELGNLRGLHELSTGDTLVSPGSLNVAYAATGGVLAAVDAVVSKRVKNAFCAVRPPGHHATANRGMGFCLLNHVAIAARYLQSKHGVGRILIIDWDYHHGNGTQDIFYRDGTVFYFSTHHYGAYPGTGAPHETGEGKGSGTTMNVPLPPGASDEMIFRALQSSLLPAAKRFQPEFILISAGFDAMRGDLLGCFDVTPPGFAAITRLVAELAAECCDGRIVSVLEGGYELRGLAASVVAHIGVLAGLSDVSEIS